MMSKASTTTCAETPSSVEGVRAVCFAGLSTHLNGAQVCPRRHPHTAANATQHPSGATRIGTASPAADTTRLQQARELIAPPAKPLAQPDAGRRDRSGHEALTLSTERSSGGARTAARCTHRTGGRTRLHGARATDCSRTAPGCRQHVSAHAATRQRNRQQRQPRTQGRLNAPAESSKNKNGTSARQ